MTIKKPLNREPIAVVGIGCRFPGGIESTADFWRVLSQGLNVVSEVPSSRFDAASFHDDGSEKHGAIRSCRGGFIDDVYGFDAEFFGLYPAEASRMDPQQRLVLEASAHAIEDSGTPLETISESRTSVFVGAFMYDHLCMQTATEQRDNITPQTAMGVATCSIANRVSHRLNLQGASITLDTACSSSLVSVHLACQSIWTGQCEGALAGGVNAILRPESTILMSTAGFLSPDGACKSFDEAANGYVRSEGVGMVYLKPLSRAVQDNDRIYATIRGSLVNSDGYTPEGFTVPSLSAQKILLSSVYSTAGIDPSMVRYVEAHGPGTSVGDPIESAAVGEHIGRAQQPDNPLWIGSVKGNIGHLEGASGIAGFIKAALIVHHGAVPPQVNHQAPNPNIDFAGLGLRVPRHLVELRQNGEHTMVGINSFGAGGTNAHIILDEAHSGLPSSTPAHDIRVLLFSAQSLAALESLSASLATHFTNRHPYMRDVAYTLAKRRSRHRHVAIIPFRQRKKLYESLSRLGSGQTSKEILLVEKGPESPRIAFAFSGQGGQWTRMGITLAQQELVFRDSLAAFDAIFSPMAGISILDEISKPENESRINSTEIVQPATVAVQIALARTLMAYGLVPDAIVGHSIGEVAAAHVAGALTLEETVTVIYSRSQIQSRATGLGTMLAVGLSSSDAQDVISRHGVGNKVAIAAMNGPTMTTLSGDSEALQLIATNLKFREMFARSVNVQVPYHSHFMDPLEHDLCQALGHIQGRATQIKLYSTVTAAVEPGTHLTGKYWFDNVRQPVRYVEAAQRMMEDGFNFVVEVGPHPVLLSGTRGVAELAKRKISVYPAMSRGDDLDPLAKVIGAAYANGADVDIVSFNGGRGRLADLPLYAFQRKQFSSEPPQVRQRRLCTDSHPFNGGSSSLTDDGRASVQLRIGTGVSPFLAEHVADGAMVFPATAHIEAAYMAAKEFAPQHETIWLEDVKFQRPLVLANPEDFAPQALLEITSLDRDYLISTRSADASASSEWRICSTGRIRTNNFPARTSFESLDAIKSRIQAGKSIDVCDFYQTLDGTGLRYGDAFRGVKQLWQLGTEVFATVKLPKAQAREATRFRFHPALLDACLHTAFAYVHRYGDSRLVYLPHHIDGVQVCDTNGEAAVSVHVNTRHFDSDSLCVDAHVYGESDRVLATVNGLTSKRLRGAFISEPNEHEIIFEESELTNRESKTDFANVLVIGGNHLELPQLAREAFPGATVSIKPASYISDTKSAAESGLKLDSRTLIILQALTTQEREPAVELDVTIPTLLNLSCWIHGQKASPAVAVVVAGAFMTAPDSQCNPATAAIEAAVRVMANELPESSIRLIDLPMKRKDWHLVYDGVKQELLATHRDLHDSAVALRPGKRFVRRIATLTVEEAEVKASKMLPTCGGEYSFEPHAAGVLGDFIVRQHASTSLGPNELVIETHAASLNFKDVMNSMNLLSDRAVSGALSGQRLGLEVAGKVVRVGESVKDIAIGTKVMARVVNGLGGRATTDRRNVFPIPSNLSMTQAASVPLIYVTAYYSLVYLARLSRGDTVLIHAAAGGVGIAATQIAKLCGARVFGTAGSEDRRAWVAEQGVEAVFDSRSPSFQENIMVATNGRGVDVVLNCLNGALLTQSFACLAPFGRFIEIGKADIYRNMKLGLEPFGENRSFTAVDVDRMIVQKPDLHSEIFSSICHLLQSGKLIPPPITEFPITQLSTAMKQLSRSQVIGKVVLTMPSDTTIQAVPTSRLHLRADRSYLITGGATGLGLQIARLLGERGAKHLILASRSGPKTAGDEAHVEEMMNRGVAITNVHVDISDRKAVAALFDRRDWPAIAGVVHCAGICQDRNSFEMSTSDFWAVFNPKALGAWNLHLATKEKDLDFFAMTSSVASVLGSVGQLNYAAANQFLDSLAHHRRAMGLPGLSLNYGVLQDFAGMATSSKNLVSLLESQGLSAMSLPMVLNSFERSILQGATQRMSANIDWSNFLGAYPHLRNDTAFAGLGIQEGTSSDSASDPSELSLESIAEVLRSTFAKLIGVENDRISLTESIDQYSFDSLTLTQIRSLILQQFRVSYAILSLSQGPTLQAIAEEVATQISDPSKKQVGALSTEKQGPQQGLRDGLRVISDWLVRGKSPANPRGRLIMFPPMGTGASFYSHFLLEPPKGFDPIAVQLPGRETRKDEPVPSTIAEIVEAISSEIGEIGADDIFWGHSVGGIIAFETIRALQTRKKSLPRLMITGSMPPHLVHRFEKRDAISALLNDGSTAQPMQDNDFSRSISESFRKDVPFLRRYQFDGKGALNIPITAFAARQDDIVYPDEVRSWKSYTKDFTFVEVDGDHWFLYRNRELVRETFEGFLC